jgi:serine protease Do
MKAGIVTAGTILLLALMIAPVAGKPRVGRSRSCRTPYARDLALAAPTARRAEATTRYTFCVRSVAVYDCLYYGPTGKVRHRRETVTAHGTAFAFRRVGKQTYLMTNEHITEWPFVTTGEQTVDGVPTGCRRVSQTVTIVDREDDAYGKDDLALQKVVSDAELDVSIFKAPIRVLLIPFTLGQSSALEAGTAVQVRGYPLGAFQALSVGKVINPRERDTEGRWNHLDFVIDAQLSSGNSGSPVLAVSCKTGRYELMGIYHAGYREGQSLNVVVGIDDLRELMTTLKPRRRTRGRQRELTAADRRRLLIRLRDPSMTPLVPLGGRVLWVRTVGDRLLYDIFSKAFPLADRREAVLEDLPSTGFGRLGRIWFGGETGLAEQTFSALKPDEQRRLAQLVRSIRQHLFLVLELRRKEAEGRRSRAAYDRLQQLRRRMGLERPALKLQVRWLADIAARYAPAGKEGLSPGVTVTPPARGSRKASPPAPPGGGRTSPGARGDR